MAYATTINQAAILKELYLNNDDFLKDLVYAKNPLLALIPKDDSPSAIGGKYLPIPIESGLPQGRSHDFASAQADQTAAFVDSFFVYRVKDYEIVTIDNELMKATMSDAAAFTDEMKFTVDGGIKNISNNMAFELFSDGTCTRGLSTSSSTQNSTVASGTVLPLSNVQQVVNFERGMLLVASATRGGAPSSDTVVVTSVNRATGVILGTASAGSLSANWAIGTGTAYLSIKGDVPSAGVTTINTALGLCGLAAWIPQTSPSSTAFWGVDRSTDPTRLGGLRYDASAMTIEEGLTNALGFGNREGANFDLAVIDFASYTALVNALGKRYTTH